MKNKLGDIEECLGYREEIVFRAANGRSSYCTLIGDHNFFRLVVFFCCSIASKSIYMTKFVVDKLIVNT